MNETEFEKIVEDTLLEIRETLVVKGKEYRRNGDPFHNFTQGAKRTGMLREQVLDGFLLKHEISISDMTNDLSKNGSIPKIETVKEKFNDLLIYNIIKKASLIDRINNVK